MKMYSNSTVRKKQLSIRKMKKNILYLKDSVTNTTLYEQKIPIGRKV